MKKVLVLGGGFAGVEAAIALQKSKSFEVTLVSNRDYLYLYPISIWIPTDGIQFKNVKLPLQKIQKAFPFRLVIDKVVSIRTAENKVELQHQVLDYDYLVVAIGADKLQPKGVDHTFTICGAPEGNLAFRDAFQALVKKGEGKIAIGFGGNPKDKSAVRGGPGFELIFNIDHYLRKKGLRDKFELNFFAPMEQPGARMGKGALKMMGKLFAKRNLHQHLGKKIVQFEADGVVFEDNSKLTSDLTMFISAGTGSSVFKQSDLPLTEAGFIHIDKYCKVIGSDNVWAVGDSAGLEGTDFVAKQGHLAEIMGRFAAHNILQTETGGSDFQNYHEHISILCVMDTGDGAAYVYRDIHKEYIIPMPVVGHWMKKGWGWYQKWTKTGKIPRLPGL
ncbi:MAG: FAD-dependent oxidoreductase [Paludibacter sp.]|jgi:sulfide:quinone oxidoreductase|nr:FAD-dependent oxidoreductase [Paludibacter sp.]